MKRLLLLTIYPILTVVVKANVESKVWELMNAVYPKMEHLQKCGSDIEINLEFKRLIVHNNVILCGESKFFQYKRLLRNNLGLAVKICHLLNIQNKIFEHFGTNYSKAYCIWPKIFSEMNYCIARSRSNSSSEPVKNLHNCSETEILIKLEQKPPTRSMKTIFRKTEKEDQKIPNASMAKIGKHSLNELIRQLSFNNSLNGEVNVKADRLNDREAMILQLNHHWQNEENECHGD